jgi:hypothetical protein
VRPVSPVPFSLGIDLSLSTGKAVIRVQPTVLAYLCMTLTAESRLILLRVKIERAKRNLTDLETEISAHTDRYLSVAIGTRVSHQRGSFWQMSTEPTYRLPVLPWNALSLAGDVIHNLRSALDHLAYQLAVVGTHGKEPSRQVEFPIAKDFSTYENSKAKKVEGMRPDAVKFIDDLKPYKGGNDLLWKIHELDNIDKHRVLFTVDQDYLFYADWMAGPDHTYLMRANKPHFVGIFDLEVEKDIQLEIDEAVNNPKVGQSNALLPSLHQLVHFVDDLVPRFLPLLE